MTFLNRLDIYIPFEFVQKCVERTYEEPVLWSGSINDILASANSLDALASFPMSSEANEYNSNTDTMHPAKVQTAKDSKNVFQMSFSDIQLQVMEGQCGFCLSNVTQNEPILSMQLSPPRKHDSESYVDKLSKLSPNSSVNSLINYVATLNNTGDSCDLNCGASITESPPINSFDSVNSEDFQNLVMLNCSGEKSEAEKAEHPDISLNKISPQNLSTTSLSPLESSSEVHQNNNVKITENISSCELPSQVNQRTFSSYCESKESSDVSQDVTTVIGDPIKNVTSMEIETIEAEYLFVKPQKRQGRKPKNMQNKTKCDPKENVTVPRQSKRIKLRGGKLPKYLVSQAKKNNKEAPKTKVVDETCDFEQNLEDCAVENSESGVRKDDQVASDLSVPSTSILENSKLNSSRLENDTDSNKMCKPVRRKRNNVRVVQCRYCKKMFCDYTGVDEHVKKFHSSETNFLEYVAELKKLKVVKCSKCDAILQNRYLLQDHENRIHFQVDSQICNQCGKSYKNLKSLRNHVNSVHHMKEKSNLCHLCPAKFKWAGTLKQHIQEIHEGVRQFSCPTCKKEFFRKSQLNRHKRIHGSDTSKRIVCKQCNKSFWFENNYIRHINILHQPQKEMYHCSYCGKGFNQKASMVSHVQLVHFNLYTFTCKVCNTGFTRSKLLQAHMKQAHNDADFVVESCRRNRFKYNRTAEELLYCTYCKIGFYYKAKLVEHIHQEHLSYFPHCCDKCQQGFLEKKYLDNHLKKAHNFEEIVNSKQQKVNISQDQHAEEFTKTNCNPSESKQLDVTNEERCEELLPAAAAESSTYNVPSTPLLVEVSNVDNTIHYLIQHTGPEDDSENNQHVIDNITSLLLVAEQASSKESLPMASMQNQTEFFEQLQYNTFQS